MSDVAVDGFSVRMARKKVADEVGKTRPVRVYIEGDGRAYLSGSQVSGNPTPGNPVGLKLAVADTQPGEVIYLARPCQFVALEVHTECRARDIYTKERWSERVVAGYATLLAEVLPAGAEVELVGYSGGAYIALAVAGRLPEGTVSRVVTVAGNLLPNAVHAAHGIKPLEDVAALDWGKLARVQQLHYIGVRDKVIPASLKDSYVAAAGVVGQAAVASGFWRWVEVEASHGEGWEGVKVSAD